MVYSSLSGSKTREHYSEDGEVSTYIDKPLHPSFFCSWVPVGQDKIAHEMLDIWCRYGMKFSESL